jgi:hypothetical protein
MLRPSASKHAKNVIGDHLAMLSWNIRAGSCEMWTEQNIIERAQRMIARQWLRGKNVQGCSSNAARP